MDKLCSSTVPYRQPKLLYTIGTKRVAKTCTITITVVCSMHATGFYLPAVLIYPGKRIRPELVAHLDV